MEYAALLNKFPPNVQHLLGHVDFAQAEEIRLRLGLPLMVYYCDGHTCLNRYGQPAGDVRSAYIVTREDMDNTLSILCDKSVYAWQDEIRNGFLTIEGGHRVGLCGRAVMEEGKLVTMKDISGLNVRIAHEVVGACEQLLPDILDGGGVRNTLIISPPQCGKTTILRDLARVLSREHKVTVVDERSELAGMYKGVRQFDLGPQTDVLDGMPKARGMLMAVRSLSPEVIITDEIGLEEDIRAVEQVFNAGSRLVTSIHGYDIESIRHSKGTLLELFDLAIVLTRRDGTQPVAHNQVL